MAKAARKDYKEESRLVYISEFEKTVLDFQLEEHTRFLSEFNRLFKAVDVERKGSINEN